MTSGGLAFIRSRRSAEGIAMAALAILISALALTETLVHHFPCRAIALFGAHVGAEKQLKPLSLSLLTLTLL
jgi:hypothetical protein